MPGVRGSWTVGRLARRFGLSRSTLLYYDSVGLLRPSDRSPAGYRLYTEKDLSRLEHTAVQRLEAAGFEPDFISIRDALTLAEPQSQVRALIVLGAARLGQARLIDNIYVDRVESTGST